MNSSPYQVAGIMGWPVSQSRSPLIHNYWIKHYGLAGSYIRMPVNDQRPNGLRDAIAGMRAMGFAGCNLTMPHKTAALAFVDKLDPIAKQMGAVNTLVFEVSGLLTGFNFDGFGFIESLREVGLNDLSACAMTILGSGGAARAILLALANAGASDIRLTSRTNANASQLAKQLMDEYGIKIHAIPWEDKTSALHTCDLLVNATNQGMYGHSALDLSLETLPMSALVYDIVYVPLETPLLKEAKQRGLRTLNGLGMLLHQARPAFRSWFGILPDITQELREQVLATFHSANS